MQFLPNEAEQRLILEIQEYHRNEYALVRMTFTMMKKGIIDASQPIVEILNENAIFDFSTALDGDISYRPVTVFTAKGLKDSRSSFYRPKAKPNKPGDPRFWPARFKSYVSQDELVYITAHEDKLILIPLNEACCNRQNLIAAFGEKKSSYSVIQELLEKLRSLDKQWIRSCAPMKDSPKDVGDTLELALGLPINNKGTADYKGEIELKAKRSASKTMDTLFSQVPDWQLSPIKSVRDMIIKYGYPSNHAKRVGFKDLFVTVSHKPNPQGLYLEVDYEKGQLIQYFQCGNKKEVTAIWLLSKLEERLNEKHPKTAWIIADKDSINGEIHFKYTKVEVTQNPIFSQFLLLIEQGIVTYDWRGGHEINGKGRVDKGHAFRLKSPKYRELLFGKTETFEL